MCETWSLKLREDSRLMVFQNSVLRRILRLKWDKERREWRKEYKEELNDPLQLTKY